MTSNEKRLLNLLGLVVLLLALVFAIVFYLRTKESLTMQIETLETARLEADVWLEEKSLWDKRRAWVKENMQVLPGDGSAASSLLQNMQSSASSTGLTILSQSLSEPVNTGLFDEYSIRLKVSGTLEQLARWLDSVQSPGNFHAVTAFNLKSDKDPPGVVCELQVTRYYQPSNET